MKCVSTHEAKTHLSRILDEVSKGQVYIITRNDKPIAELRSRDKAKRSEPHPVLSRIKIRYDPAEDLSAEEWGQIGDTPGYVQPDPAGRRPGRALGRTPWCACGDFGRKIHRVRYSDPAVGGAPIGCMPIGTARFDPVRQCPAGWGMSPSL